MNTLIGILRRIPLEGPDEYYMELEDGGRQVYFKTEQQGIDTPINTRIALAVSKAGNVHDGEGWFSYVKPDSAEVK